MSDVFPYVFKGLRNFNTHPKLLVPDYTYFQMSARKFHRKECFSASNTGYCVFACTPEYMLIAFVTCF